MLEVKNLYGGYPDRDVIKNVSFKLGSSDLLFVIGPNGSGKTTLFKLVLGMLTKKSGSILLDGKETKSLTHEQVAKKIAYIPQAHEPTFDYTVKEMVLMGRVSHIGMFAMPSKADVALAEKAMGLFNLLPFAEREYAKLSGGEMQMVLIARAVCQQASIVIMDEPMMNLDYKNQSIVLNAIATLQANGLTVMMSTHHLIHTEYSHANVLLLQDGHLIGYGSASQMLTKQKLEAVYGVPLDVVKMTDSNGKQRYAVIPL